MTTTSDTTTPATPDRTHPAWWDLMPDEIVIHRDVRGRRFFSIDGKPFDHLLGEDATVNIGNGECGVTITLLARTVRVEDALLADVKPDPAAVPVAEGLSGCAGECTNTRCGG